MILWQYSIGRRFIILCCVGFWGLGVYAASANPAGIQGEAALSSVTLSRVEAAFNCITTLKARFTQTDRQGHLAKGWFYLERPGKVRFDYDAPNPNLIISNNGPLYHVDKELKERSELPRTNPLYLFLKGKISFRMRDVRVKSFTSGASSVRLVLAVFDEPGTLTLIFEAGTLHLRQWILEDDDHHKTTIDLEQSVYGEHFPASIFKRIELP